jgi:hypothetical protein
LEVKDRNPPLVTIDTNGPHQPLARDPSAALQLSRSSRSTHCAAFLLAIGSSADKVSFRYGCANGRFDALGAAQDSLRYS